jgi:hypothetical protein
MCMGCAWDVHAIMCMVCVWDGIMMHIGCVCACDGMCRGCVGDVLVSCMGPGYVNVHRSSIGQKV